MPLGDALKASEMNAFDTKLFKHVLGGWKFKIQRTHRLWMTMVGIVIKICNLSSAKSISQFSVVKFKFCPSRGPRATWGAILDNKFLEIPRSQMIFHELDILMHFDIFDIFLSSGIQAQPKPSRFFPGFHGLQIVVVSARHGTSWTPVNPLDLQAEVEVC